jgi:hypothetical protein
MDSAQKLGLVKESGSHGWLEPYYSKMTQEINVTSRPNHNTNPFIINNCFTNDPKYVKQTWISNELRKRQERFSSFTNLNIYVGTWNVNGQIISDSLSKWIKSEHLVDVYALGYS